jgi:hypothetical protein
MSVCRLWYATTSCAYARNSSCHTQRAGRRRRRRVGGRVLGRYHCLVLDVSRSELDAMHARRLSREGIFYVHTRCDHFLWTQSLRPLLVGTGHALLGVKACEAPERVYQVHLTHLNQRN